VGRTLRGDAGLVADRRVLAIVTGALEETLA
jgi:hypothetical protein